MRIDNGKREANVYSDVFENNPTMKDDLANSLNARFLGVQILTHKPYQISKALMYRLHPDGSRIAFFVQRPFGGIIFGGRSEIIIGNKDGNVIVDTRRDRIERKKKLSELVENTSVLTPRLPSFLTAIIWLLEIRIMSWYIFTIFLIFIEKIWGNKNKSRKMRKLDACHALNISSEEWKYFERLANSEPLKQGRHRGMNPETLRSATESELDEARRIVRTFIEAYILDPSAQILK